MRAHATLAIALLAGWTLLARADVPGSTPGIDCLCPRAPAEQLAALRSEHNPFDPTPSNVARGRALYLGKGFCAVCHGLGGRGLGSDVDRSRIQGVLPRDFGDPDWQSVRSDGEIHWVIAHGISGTAMASFVPSVLSPQEAWLVVLWLRTRDAGAHGVLASERTGSSGR
jgi:mono/diheme cytochrome c family protein